MKKSIRRRLVTFLPVGGLAGLMVAGVVLLGGFGFAGSAEAECSTRWFSRSCPELPSTVTVTETETNTVISTVTVTSVETVTVTVTMTF